MAARRIVGPAEATLRRPPPLDQPLELVTRGDSAELRHGDVLVAEARSTTVDVEIPDPVTLGEATRAAERYPWVDKHPYPTCFVCGPQRAAGDGLRIFPGPVEGKPLYAAPWTPDRSLAGADGVVEPEFVWAALDCPSGIVTDLFGDVGLLLLGRLATERRRPILAGASYVAQAWTLEREGRKLHTAGALFSADGELCAVARAVWIQLKKDG